MAKVISMLAMVFVAWLWFPGQSRSSDYSAWVKSETCWVVRKPSTDAKIIGIIVPKASVQVEDAGNGWLKLVFAPVRDPNTSKFIDCSNKCYIRKADTTRTPPGQW
ncbi:MAG: hypothetical protein HZB55_17880 [Deltaproteobacteria bacterium]|nr:hypothetical protein [Deltaproteobacteria bacterium]